MRDHSDINWHDAMAHTISGEAIKEFGIQLDRHEIKLIRDEIYRAVNSAKVREMRTREAQLKAHYQETLPASQDHQ